MQMLKLSAVLVVFIMMVSCGGGGGSSNSSPPASPTSWFADSDGDGFGDANTSLQSTTQPAGFVSDATDCDDSDLAVNPSAAEVADAVDNNCDGQVDEGFALVTYYLDVDNDGYGDIENTVTAAVQPVGYVDNWRDCDDANPLINPLATEVADGVDNDCNGLVDDGLPVTYYQDSDGDGYGDPGTSVVATSPPAGYVADGTDCDDTRWNINPGQNERTNGIDDDCSGVIDDHVNHVFVTSQTFTGNLVSAASSLYGYTGNDGLEAADFICQKSSEQSGTLVPSKTYKAWLSSSTVHARDRMSQSPQPYVLTDVNRTEILIAGSWLQLTDGTLNAGNRINIDEFGTNPNTPAFVFTNTDFDGTRASSDPTKTCSDWGLFWSTDTANGGSMGANDSYWTVGFNENCTYSGYGGRLYCISQ